MLQNISNSTWRCNKYKFSYIVTNYHFKYNNLKENLFITKAIKIIRNISNSKYPILQNVIFSKNGSFEILLTFIPCSCNSNN